MGNRLVHQKKEQEGIIWATIGRVSKAEEGMIWPFLSERDITSLLIGLPLVGKLLSISKRRVYFHFDDQILTEIDFFISKCK